MSKAYYLHVPSSKTTGAQTFKYHSQQWQKSKESRFKSFETQTFARIPSEQQVQEQKEYDALKKKDVSSIDLKNQIKNLKKLLQLEKSLHQKKVQTLTQNVNHLKQALQDKAQQCQHYEKINKQLVKIILAQNSYPQLNEKQIPRFANFYSTITKKKSNEINQNLSNKRKQRNTAYSSKKRKAQNFLEGEWENYQESRIDQVNQLGLSSQKDTKINELSQNKFISETTANKNEFKNKLFKTFSENADKYEKKLLLSKSNSNWKHEKSGKLNDSQNQQSQAINRYQKRFEDVKQQLQSIREQLEMKKRASAIHMR